MNFLHSSQQTAPYLRGCLRVVIEWQTWHTSEVVNINELDEFKLVESKFKEKGLFKLFFSFADAPKDPKFDNCRTGFRRIEEPCSFLASFRCFFFDLRSSSSTK